MEHDPFVPESDAEPSTQPFADEQMRLVRYVIGDLSVAERAEVERWIAVEPRRVDLLRQMRKTWSPTVSSQTAASSVASRDATAVGIEAALTIVLARIDEGGRKVHAPSGFRRWRTAGIGLAAAAAAAVGIVGWRVVAHHTLKVPVVYTTYATRVGQIAHLTLDDGTHVTLAPNTTFGVSRDFRRRRDVTLTGEAYFDVVQSHTTPFLVHTGVVTTHVLGTSFDVARYRDDRAVRVVVLEGRVTVGGKQSVTLSAGGIAHVTDSTATAATMSDATPYAAWTRGGLVFHGTPVSAMLETLGHWYGLEFRLADSALAQKAVAATFASDETRAEALELVGTLLDVTMTFTERGDGTTIVTLRTKTTGRRAPAPTRRDASDSLVPRIAEVGR